MKFIKIKNRLIKLDIVFEFIYIDDDKEIRIFDNNNTQVDCICGVSSEDWENIYRQLFHKKILIDY